MSISRDVQLAAHRAATEGTSLEQIAQYRATYADALALYRRIEERLVSATQFDETVRRPTRDDHLRIDAARADFSALRSGRVRATGVSDAELAGLYAEPTMPEVLQMIYALDARAEELKNQKVATAGLYRLKAGFRHALPERTMRAGETLELTAEQAVAFADKFEKVATEETTA